MRARVTSTVPSCFYASLLSLCMYVSNVCIYVYLCICVSVYACRCVYAKENGVTSVEIATCDRLCVEIR